ncbi:hypothetical protein [Priestia aryabhattai]
MPIVKEIEENKDYYLYSWKTKQGIWTFKEAGYHYVVAANYKGDMGDPVKFELSDIKGDNGEKLYYIKFTNPPEAKTPYVTRDSNGWVYLAKREDATPWFVFIQGTGLAFFLYYSREPGGYFRWLDRSDVRWLTTDGVQNDRTLFEIHSVE